eukprot:gene8045-12507_t
MKKATVLCLLFVVIFTYAQIEGEKFVCGNEETDIEDSRKFDELQVCPMPLVNSCDHIDKISKYPKKLTVLVPIVYYGVDCYAEDVAALPGKITEATTLLNRFFKPSGIQFESSYTILPCNGEDGTHDMRNPNRAEFKSFMYAYVAYVNPKKFVVLVSRTSESIGGSYALKNKFGFFNIVSMTRLFTAAHELGHGFGLQHTFYRTSAPVYNCDCAENSNEPDHFRGDYCADTPGCPLTSSTSTTISVSKLSNGCPKNETFWKNPSSNLMSYAISHPNPSFSDCQIKRIRCLWETKHKRSTDFKNTTELSCFGESFDNACNQKGICVEKDKCVCDKGYYGQKCDSTTSNVCFGYPENDPKACSGSDKGRCVGKDTCSCVNGYLGKDCSYWQCYGMNNTDTNTCSGNGDCSSPNRCSCKSGFKGDKCEQVNGMASPMKSTISSKSPNGQVSAMSSGNIHGIASFASNIQINFTLMIFGIVTFFFINC